MSVHTPAMFNEKFAVSTGSGKEIAGYLRKTTNKIFMTEN